MNEAECYRQAIQDFADKQKKKTLNQTTSGSAGAKTRCFEKIEKSLDELDLVVLALEGLKHHIGIRPEVKDEPTCEIVRFDPSVIGVLSGVPRELNERVSEMNKIIEEIKQALY